MFKKTLESIVALAALCSGSGIQILHPGDLIYKIGDSGNLQSQMANFGHVIYGTSTMGKLHFPAGNIQGCEEFDASHFVNDPLFDTEDDMIPIIMVDRGSCANTQKVLNAQNAGAVAVIIADDRVETVNGLNLGDDGFGAAINIPTFMIGKYDADTIKESLDDGNVIYAKAHVDMYHPDNIVEYELWYASIWDLLEDDLYKIGTYQKQFSKQGQTVFTPRIYTFNGEILPDEVRQDNCLSNGRYCASFPADGADNYPTKWSAVDLLYENLREKCLWNLEEERGTSEYRNGYFSMLINIERNCLSQPGDEVEGCFYRIMKQLGVGITETEMKQCVNESFEEPGNEQSDNKIFREDAMYQHMHGVQIHPQVVINNQTYTGEWTGKDIVSAICAGFQNPPDGCQSSEGDFAMLGEDEEFEIVYVHPRLHLIGVLLIGIACNVFLLYAYRRRTKREMSEQMSSQVNQAVSQYFALRDQSTSSI